MEAGEQKGSWAPRIGIPRAFFGLLNPLTMCALKEDLDVDTGVAYLRALATKLGLERSDAIICYAHALGSRRVRCFEVADIHKNDSQKHQRWICPLVEDALSFSAHTKLDGARSIEACQQHRVEHAQDQGEQCEILPTGLRTFEARQNELAWLDPPPAYLEKFSEDSNDAMHRSKKAKIEMKFNAIIGDWHLELFPCSEARMEYDLLQSYTKRSAFEAAKTEKVSASVSKFTKTEFAPERLRDYLSSLINFS